MLHIGVVGWAVGAYVRRWPDMVGVFRSWFLNSILNEILMVPLLVGIILVRWSPANLSLIIISLVLGLVVILRLAS